MSPSAFRLILVSALVIGAGVAPPTLSATRAAAPAESADATLQPPTGFTVRAQSGNTLTLGWIPPVGGPVPAGYVLEGGFTPGEVLAALPLGSAPTFTVAAPSGVFFLRLHSVTASERSAASNEIRVVVGVPEPPSPPANLLGLVNGGTLRLSWANTFSGGAPTQLWLQVSGAASARVPLPVSESFTYSGIPDGTYTLSVVAANASGSSAPSNAVTLTFPTTCSGAPNPPINFQTWTDGGTFHVSWAPPATGPAVATYTVHVSGTYGGSVVTTGQSLSGPLPPGDYAVSVVASNACGDSAAAPAAPDWTAVVPQGATHLVHWAPVAGATRYRIYWSDRRSALVDLDHTASFVEADTSPVALPVEDPGQPFYYRVYGLYGAYGGAGGPVALTVGFDTLDYAVWAGNLTPGLWDIDGDGCLDMVGATGMCDGTFQPYDLELKGLQGLMAGERAHTNRDSRLADFTGDGITDIFTNVYARADDPLMPSAVLYVGDGRGGYHEDPDVSALHIRGYGETVLAADFDNDGDLDIFIPHYTHRGDGGHNWLLVNDGAGHFTDVSAAAGVAFNHPFPPEAAQAIDVNDDGWIDIHVASSLYLNNGNLTFTDQAADVNLPILFDEGMRLFDVDLDGDLDLVHHDTSATRLFTNDGGTYDAGVVIDGDPQGSTFGYGLNVCDVNGDGFEDLLVANNTRGSGTGQPHLLLNVAGTFMRTPLPAAAAIYNDLLACADLDGTGLPDVVSRWTEDDGAGARRIGHRHYLNRSGSAATIRVRVAGSGGERNQQGRVVRVRPAGSPGRTMTRVVDSGSGMMAQNGYDLTIATPWAGAYEVAVRFPDGWVTATARAGDVLTIRADGTVRAGFY